MEEGRIELATLIPEGKLEILPVLPPKNKVLPKANGRRSPRSINEICDIIMNNLDTPAAKISGGLTAFWFKTKFGINANRLMEAKNKLIKSGSITIIKNGNTYKMIKVKLDKK